MLVLRFTAVAGASRVGLGAALRARSFATASRVPCRPGCALPAATAPAASAATLMRRWASSTAPSTAPPAAPSPSLSATPPSAPPAVATTDFHFRGKLTDTQWPWHRVSPPRHAGQIEDERVIYSRPQKTSGKVYWAMLILYTSGVIMYLVLPSVDEARAKGYDGDEGTVLGLPTSRFFTYISSGAITCFSVLAFLGLVYPSRLISRMSIVRSVPAAGPHAPPAYYLRMRHLGHSMMWGKRSLPRELPIKDVSVNVILGHATRVGERSREPWLSVRVHSPRSNSRFSFDGYKYRLDFRDTPDLATATGEVVLSVARIEEVFGPLQVGNAHTR